MTIKIGDKLPTSTFTIMTADGPKPMTTDDVFKGKKVALFAVPGAYTPTCHKSHMPGFVDRVAEIKAKGVDTVACTAVNDIFVLDNWAHDTGADGKIAMLVDDGVVKVLNIEELPPHHGVSSAETICSLIDRSF
jgi:glutaredoxin/glutathione-dependent peroxiredoxin